MIQLAVAIRLAGSWCRSPYTRSPCACARATGVHPMHRDPGSGIWDPGSRPGTPYPGSQALSMHMRRDYGILHQTPHVLQAPGPWALAPGPWPLGPGFYLYHSVRPRIQGLGPGPVLPIPFGETPDLGSQARDPRSGVLPITFGETPDLGPRAQIRGPRALAQGPGTPYFGPYFGPILGP